MQMQTLSRAWGEGSRPVLEEHCYCSSVRQHTGYPCQGVFTSGPLVLMQPC